MQNLLSLMEVRSRDTISLSLQLSDCLLLPPINYLWSFRSSHFLPHETLFPCLSSRGTWCHEIQLSSSPFSNFLWHLIFRTTVTVFMFLFLLLTSPPPSYLDIQDLLLLLLSINVLVSRFCILVFRYSP